MTRTTRRYAMRLFALGAVLMFAMACGQTSCDCVTPLDEPMPESEKVYDAVQLRLTPAAFNFISGNLTDIIATFLEGGLSFDVPRMDEEFCDPLFGWICFNLRLCENGCTLTAELVDVSLSRVSPDTLGLDALINLDGTVTIRGSLDCDVPIHVQNKPVHADVRFIVDGRDHLVSFVVENLQVELSNDDYDLDCAWWYDWLMELLKGVMTGLINSTLAGQMDTFLGDALNGMSCLACDFYATGCPPGSTCNGDDFCEQDGSCRINPLGIVGTMDLGTLLADISPGMQAELDLFVAVGQWEDAAVDPIVVNDGVELRMIGGADTEANVCVPVPDPAEIPTAQPPPRLPFVDVVPGTATEYMAGIGVSDAFLDWFMYKAYLSGLLCLSIDTEMTGGRSPSGTLAALLGSLNTLTGGRNTPVKLQLVPNHVPTIDVGAGTFTTDADGNRIMDEPLINVIMPGVGIDFFVLVDERWVRTVTLTQDISLRIGLDFLPDNTVLPLFDENSVSLDNVVASNYELLAEDPAALEDLVPTLISMFLPLLTGSLGAIEIPPVEGFILTFEAVQGDLPRPNSDYYEYMAMYANLDLVANPLPAPRRTEARVTQVNTPLRSLMSVFAPGGPQYPEVILEVGADRGPEAEFSYRLDRGNWSLFQSGPKLVVHDPRLAIEGDHLIEVRGRTAGDYRSLDDNPIRLTVNIAAEDDEHSYQPPLGARGLARLHELGIAPIGQAVRAQADEDEPTRVGCATAGAGLSLLGLFGLGLLALRRRRH